MRGWAVLQIRNPKSPVSRSLFSSVEKCFALADAWARRALVTILEEAPDAHDTALLSEAALAEDWNRAEEDAAWAYLQPGKSS